MKIKKIVLSFQAHEKEVTRLQQEIDIAREQKDIAIKRVKYQFFEKTSLFTLTSHMQSEYINLKLVFLPTVRSHVCQQNGENSTRNGSSYPRG